MSENNILGREISDPEIPQSELQLRRDKAIQNMTECGLEGLLMLNPMNVIYYSGFRSPCPLHWIECCILSKEGQISLILPQILHEFSRSSIWLEDEWIRPYGGALHWRHEQDPVAVIIKTIKDMGLAEKTIGVELGSAASFMVIGLSDFDRVRKGLPAAKFVDAVGMIFKQRMIKTAWEQDVMRTLVNITAKGFKVGLESVHEGMTEEELYRICWKVYVDEGACDAPMGGVLIFRGGAKNYGMSVPRHTNRPLNRGRQMFFDGGASMKGYYSDFQRQFSIGEPPALQKRLVEISELGQQAAEKMIKPGNRLCDVHAAAMSVIDKVPSDLASQGIESLYSHTFMGHGLGLNVHEPPMISADNETMIEPGMVLCMEIPGLDIPQFRVLGGFPEDIYLVTENGHEVLSASLERKEYIIS